MRSGHRRARGGADRCGLQQRRLTGRDSRRQAQEGRHGSGRLDSGARRHEPAVQRSERLVPLALGAGAAVRGAARRELRSSAGRRAAERGERRRLRRRHDGHVEAAQGHHMVGRRAAHRRGRQVHLRRHPGSRQHGTSAGRIRPGRVRGGRRRAHRAGPHEEAEPVLPRGCSSRSCPSTSSTPRRSQPSIRRPVCRWAPDRTSSRNGGRATRSSSSATRTTGTRRSARFGWTGSR